ncbi:MAG: hypothetical protein AAF649_09895, partial [Verrucomicrobiota bacterium]
MSEESNASLILKGPSADGVSLPDWWNAGSLDAWKRFESLPMPSRKDEDWRFASIRSIKLEDYRFTTTAPTPDAELPELEIEALARACFI